MNSPGCTLCRGLGYTIDLEHSNHKKCALELCECAKTQCQCEQESPYYAIVTSDSGLPQMSPCQIYPLHLKMDRIANLYKESEIPSRYRYKFYNAHFEVSHLRSNDFIEKMNTLLPPIWEGKKPSLPSGLYLSGYVGSGKTLLAAIVINELIFRHAIPAFFMKTTRSLERIRQTYNIESESYGQGAKIEDLLHKVPVLVLDDLGAQKDSSWTDETLYDIIDTRYEEGLFTIITSNKKLNDLKELAGGRIASRLKEICDVLQFPEIDYREIIHQRKR